MAYNPEIHHRRSIRLPDYDYAQPGAYFVTFCVAQGECLFGEIVGGVVRLSRFGVIAREEWFRSAEIRAGILLYEEEFVIMPNHGHGIIRIISGDDWRGSGRPRGEGDRGLLAPRAAGSPLRPAALAGTGDRPVAPAPLTRSGDRGSPLRPAALADVRATGGRPAPIGPAPHSIGAILAGYKASVTKRINQLRGTPGAPVWHRNFWEHVIRNESDLARIRQYIADNPARWADDQLHPAAAANELNRRPV